jgi:hypothetical protein
MLSKLSLEYQTLSATVSSIVPANIGTTDPKMRRTETRKTYIAMMNRFGVLDAGVERLLKER